MRVREELETWPESDVRQRRWVTAEEAAREVRPPEMTPIIDNLVRRVAETR